MSNPLLSRYNVEYNRWFSLSRCALMRLIVSGALNPLVTCKYIYIYIPDEVILLLLDRRNRYPGSSHQHHHHLPVPFMERVYSCIYNVSTHAHTNTHSLTIIRKGISIEVRNIIRALVGAYFSRVDYTYDYTFFTIIRYSH